MRGRIIHNHLTPRCSRKPPDIPIAGLARYSGKCSKSSVSAPEVRSHPFANRDCKAYVGLESRSCPVLMRRPRIPYGRANAQPGVHGSSERLTEPGKASERVCLRYAVCPDDRQQFAIGAHGNTCRLLDLELREVSDDFPLTFFR